MMFEEVFYTVCSLFSGYDLKTATDGSKFVLYHHSTGDKSLALRVSRFLNNFIIKGLSPLIIKRSILYVCVYIRVGQ